MRYGPIDLTPFGAVLDAVNWIYWIFVAAVAIYAWKRATTRKQRITRMLVILVLFGTLPALRMVAAVQAQYRFNATMALYQDRCRSAGEKITRTVEGVDGVVWMRWRDTSFNFDDQFKLNDPYGWDCGGEECIKELLRIDKGLRLQTAEAKRHERGYLFVETIDPRDGKRYRYSGQMKPHRSWTPEGIERHRIETGRELDPDSYRFTLEREPIETYTARYGITWEDISTREDRERWIAGGALKAIDLRSNEVIAERIGFMVDRGQGSTAGERAPWSYAKDNACPALLDPAGKPTRIGFTARFAWRVLQPSNRE